MAAVFNRVQSPPQRLLENLLLNKPENYRYLNLANQLVFDVNKFNLQKLFQSLDRNQDGVLNAKDFVAPDVNQQAILKAVYQRIRSEFDFDADGIVSFKEFIDGFILEAWLTIPPDGGHTVNMSIGDELHYWATRFNKELEYRMNAFNSAVRVNPGRNAKRACSQLQLMWPVMSIRHASEESMMEIDVADAKRVRSGSIFYGNERAVEIRTGKGLSKKDINHIVNQQQNNYGNGNCNDNGFNNNQG